MRLPPSLQHLIVELRQATRLAGKVAKTSLLPASPPAIPPSWIAEVEKAMGKADWEMITHNTIEGFYFHQPYYLSIDITFHIAMEPLIKAHVASNPGKSEDMITLLNKLQPDLDPQLSEILLTATWPLSGGVMVDYTILEGVMGDIPKEALTFKQPDKGMIFIHLEGDEAVMDYHHLLMPLTPEAVTAYQPPQESFTKNVRIAIAEFQHDSPLHRTYTFEDTPNDSHLTTTTAIHWQKLK